MTKAKKIKEPITLSEIAKLININKSKLHYYASLGLIEPWGRASNTLIFEKKVVLKRLDEIERMQRRDIKLADIKEKF